MKWSKRYYSTVFNEYRYTRNDYKYLLGYIWRNVIRGSKYQHTGHRYKWGKILAVKDYVLNRWR